jgi:hypothetical protein
MREVHPLASWFWQAISDRPPAARFFQKKMALPTKVR